jgi:hypothetical protein
MNAKHPVLDTKRIAFSILGAIGVTAILTAVFANSLIHKGLEPIRVTRML